MFFSMLVLSGMACGKLLPQAKEEDELLDGPLAGLSAEENQRFLNGDIAFNDEVFTPQTGLGPIFVATSCGSCHAGDGKGHPFTTLTRFGQSDSTGNTFMDKGGPQLQHRAIPGYEPEQIPAGATFSRFTPPANTGLGFIEALTDAQILAHADPYDSDQDGISGRPNYVSAPWFFTPQAWHIEKDGKYIARYGKKAGAITLLHQTVNAYNQDMGINSLFAPIDTYTKHEIDPEVSTQTINDVVFYLRTLKAPVQRNPNKAEVIAGRELFNNIGCHKCHTPEFKTGNCDVAALSNKTFTPYTDLLLHDMGSELDDHYSEGGATTSEWKTPALWGLGLSKKSQGGQYYLLHDGRAASIEQAIQFHGGEGAMSRQKFNQLNQGEKDKLIEFLESL